MPDNKNDMTIWEKFRNRSLKQTIEYRDVQGNQQIDRTKIGNKKPFTPYLVLDAALSIAMFFGVYIILGFFSAAIEFMAGQTSVNGMRYYIMHFSFARFMIAFVSAAGFFGILYMLFKRIHEGQNADEETADINQYDNDQHIAFPEEIQRKFDIFPDVGATSSVTFSSMISHCAISNKGLDPVMIARRVPKDIVDEDGDVVLYKGEILRDEDGNALLEEAPIVDIDFMNALYKASGVPDKEDLRKFYDPRLIEYNPGNENREKLKDYDTWADVINGDWQLPEYEPQRPGGVYIVDTAPVNTMVFC